MIQIEILNSFSKEQVLILAVSLTLVVLFFLSMLGKLFSYILESYKKKKEYKLAELKEKEKALLDTLYRELQPRINNNSASIDKGRVEKIKSKIEELSTKGRYNKSGDKIMFRVSDMEAFANELINEQGTE